MKSEKTYYQWLAFYVGLFLILLLGSIFIALATRGLLFDNLIAEEKLRLEAGSASFEQNVQSMGYVCDNLYAREDVSTLRRCKGKLPASDYVEMLYVREQMRTYNYVGKLPYNFIIFRDNPVFLSGTSVWADFDTYYGKLMQADNLSADEFRDLLFSGKKRVNYIRLDSFTYLDNVLVTVEDPLLMILYPIPSTGNMITTQCQVFLFTEEELLSNYLVDQILGEAPVQITDVSSGQVMLRDSDHALFSSEQEDYYLLQTTFQGLDMQVGIPYASVWGQVYHSMRGILLLLMISAIYTVVVALTLAWRRYHPAKKMVEFLQMFSDEPIRAKNEYELARKTVRQLDHANKQLQRELSKTQQDMINGVMINMLVHGIVNESDVEKLESLLGEYPEFYYVVTIRSDKAAMSHFVEVSQYLKECFLNQGVEYIYEMHPELSETVYLLEHNESNSLDISILINRLHAVIAEAAKRQDITFCVGISEVGEGIEGLNTCYEQAKQAAAFTARENENTVGCYQLIKQTMGDGYLDIPKLYKIYDLIIIGNKETVGTMIDTLLDECERCGNESRKKEFFYTLSGIAASAARKLALNAYQDDHVKYNPKESLTKQINLIKERLLQMIDSYESNKHSHNTRLRDDIIKFIEAHYDDPNLSAMSVCDELHISAKYLSRFLKEQTQKTFAKYLEDVRIDKAKEYLLTTDMSNKEVAEKVGFGSLNTFYRVFNRAEGMSPVNWKKASQTHQLDPQTQGAVSVSKDEDGSNQDES